MRAAILLAAAGLVACATDAEEEERPPLTSRQAREQALVEETHAYIQSNNLVQHSSIRYFGKFNIVSANRRYAVIEARTTRYLIETEIDCPRLPLAGATDDSIDVRMRRNLLRAGYDTIRGCRISSIWELPDLPAETSEPEDGQNNEP